MPQYIPVTPYIRLLVFVNAGALAIMLFVNSLANALPVNGVTTGAVSDEYPNLFVPAGITFSIWGIIYIQLIAFSVYAMSLLFSSANSKNQTLSFVRAIGPWFFISCIANATWIITWHHQQIGLSLALMAVLLISLIAIYRRLIIGRLVRPSLKLLVHLPFSVYLGWISVAVIANVAALLVSHGWTGWPATETFWAVTMILAAMGLGVILLKTRGDIGFAMVIIWACFGILFKRFTTDDPAWNLISIVALIAMFLLSIQIVLVATRK